MLTHGGSVAGPCRLRKLTCGLRTVDRRNRLSHLVYTSIVIWLYLLTIAAQAAPLNNYVDARICAGCHSQIAQNHLQTGMGRSLFRPTPANTVEDYIRNNEFYHPLSET